jgi:cobalt/nickel transport system ATP-binding protein
VGSTVSGPIFELTDVAYAYQNVVALDGVTLSVQAGQRVALLGANGSGKSTLLRLMDALCFPSRGTIRAFGQPLTEAGLQHDTANFAFRRRVGLVFQNPDVQLFNPTVFDELAFGPLQLGWPKERIRHQIEEALARFSIGHLKDRPPHRLSGGEKKRVALASVLILEPDVLLLDEPTAALDPESQSAVVHFLMACRDTGQTVITATHDLDIVDYIADYGFVLAGGQVVQEGPTASLLEDVAMLQRTHLSHSHWHTHPDGHVHAHHHLHRDPIVHQETKAPLSKPGNTIRMPPNNGR